MKTITLVSNRGDVVKTTSYRAKRGLVEVDRPLLRDWGRRKGFDPPDYWEHAVMPDGTKVLIRGVG